jgi:uncharacterized protein (DUF1697 family)
VTVHIALLRGVNLGPRRRVSMADLKQMVSDLGFEDVRTVLQSGNVVFRTAKDSGAALEDLLETEFAKRLGLRTDFFVRSADQLEKVIVRNPLPTEAQRDPSHLLVMFCKKALGKSLRISGADREVVEPAGREIFVYYPSGIGRSRLKIDAVATGRNWNTVLKLAALADELHGGRSGRFPPE